MAFTFFATSSGIFSIASSVITETKRIHVGDVHRVRPEAAGVVLRDDLRVDDRLDQVRRVAVALADRAQLLLAREVRGLLHAA